MNDTGVSTPAVLVDLDQADHNIRAMVGETLKQGIAHRPHIKTHKSVFLAARQIELGACGVTCAKLGEAEVMADGGIDDILIAFPLIGADKLARYRALLERGVALRTVVNSEQGARGLSELGLSMGARLDVLIELDGGIRRGGLPPYEPALRFARRIAPLEGIQVVGLLYYGGDIYGCKDEAEVRSRAELERDEIVGTAELLRRHGFDMRILSGGSSFSAKMPDCLAGLTEVRAGNYIFNDGAQLGIGMVREDQCALTVLATVVGRPDEHSAIIDAGTKTLSSDLIASRGGYGFVTGRPEIAVHKLNEEHGFLRSQSPIGLEIGERISIIPNHACVVPNLVGRMYGVRGGRIERMLNVEARGRVD